MERFESIGNGIMALSIFLGIITIFFTYELGCTPKGPVASKVDLEKRRRNLKAVSWAGLFFTVTSVYASRLFKPVEWFRINCDWLSIHYIIIFLVLYAARVGRLKT